MVVLANYDGILLGPPIRGLDCSLLDRREDNSIRWVYWRLQTSAEPFQTVVQAIERAVTIALAI